MTAAPVGHRRGNGRTMVTVRARDELTDDDLEWLNRWACDVVFFERWPWPEISIEPDANLLQLVWR